MTIAPGCATSRAASRSRPSPPQPCSRRRSRERGRSPPPAARRSGARATPSAVARHDRARVLRRPRRRSSRSQDRDSGRRRGSRPARGSARGKRLEAAPQRLDAADRRDHDRHRNGLGGPPHRRPRCRTSQRTGGCTTRSRSSASAGPLPSARRGSAAPPARGTSRSSTRSTRRAGSPPRGRIGGTTSATSTSRGGSLDCEHVAAVLTPYLVEHPDPALILHREADGDDRERLARDEPDAQDQRLPALGVVEWPAASSAISAAST